MSSRPRSVLALASVALSWVTVLPAAGQLVTEVRKLNATDAESFDSLGSSVAVSGTTAIVGAIGDVIGGSAYLFDFGTGQQLFKLKAADAGSSDNFGASVAISGTIALVGAPLNDTNDTGGASTNAGAAYVFDTTTGQQLFKLTALDARPSDIFGSAVALSGSIAIVGAPGDDESRGAAYVFNTVTGAQLLKITADDGFRGDFFGNSVSVSGNTAIIGAPRDDDGFPNSGSAYLFDITTGTQLFKLNASDPGLTDWFGFAVAISGTTAIVGAHLNDEADLDTDDGSAYLFDTTTGQQLFKLTDSDGTSDVFGYAVSISGTTAIVGAYLNDDQFTFDNGLLYAFDTTTGQELFRLGASDAANNDRLGESVVISGSTVIAGADQDDDGGVNSGSAYVFEIDIDTGCQADWNDDGSVNILDVIAFVNVWNAAGPGSDFNADGNINILDVIAFITVWNVGCP